MESAIAAGALRQLAAELRGELAALSARDVGGNALLQLRKQSLIVDQMHACDVVEGLLDAKGGPPASAADWGWARQLRYYLEQVR